MLLGQQRNKDSNKKEKYNTYVSDRKKDRDEQNQYTKTYTLQKFLKLHSPGEQFVKARK